MKKKCIVRLTEQERSDLVGMVRHGKAAAYRRTHAQILLSVDAEPPKDCGLTMLRPPSGAMQITELR